MSRLQSLYLRGFKSFLDPVRFEWTPGISAIVGPNGSGKSNVVEALKWVTYSAKARDLRAKTATDLIFHGAGQRAQTGLAEVGLELSLPSGHLQIQRRLYRDGTAEQDIGNQRVRVRDIHQALLGTGLGAAALAIIGQGEVSGVLGADPKTLLGYVEEAAGLSPLALAHRETLDRLSENAQHMQNLLLISAERQSHLDTLSKEAERLKVHTQLSIRRETLLGALQREEFQRRKTEILSLRQRESVLAADIDDLEKKTTEWQVELARLHDEKANLRLRQSEWTRAQEHVQAMQTALDGAQTLMDRLAEERLERQKEYESLEGLVPSGSRPDIAPLTDLLATTQNTLRVLQKDIQNKETQLNQIRQKLRLLEQQRGKHEALGAEYEIGLARLLACEETRKRALEALNDFREGKPDLNPSRESLRTSLIQKREEQRLERRHLESTLGAVQRERKQLDQTLSAYSRYGQGSKQVLSQKEAGVLGSVADLLGVPEGYEMAIHAALGRRLEHIVVETADVARTWIAYLKKKGGRATFLPLDLIRAKPHRDGSWHARGVVGWADDLCTSDPDILARHLLGDTLIVEDDNTAIFLARQRKSRPRLVSLTGEILEPGGALTGGQLRDQGHSHLSDVRRLHELDAECADLTERLRQLGAQEGKATLQLQHLEGELEAYRCVQDTYQKQLNSLEIAYRQAEQRVQQAKDHLSDLSHRMNTAPPEMPGVTEETLEQQLLDLRDRLLQAQQDEHAHRENLETAKRALLSWQHAQEHQKRRQYLETTLGKLEIQLRTQEGHLREAQMALEEALGRAARIPFPEENRHVLEMDTLMESHRQLNQTLKTQRSRMEQLRITLGQKEALLGEMGEIRPSEVEVPGTPQLWSEEVQHLEQHLMDLGPVDPRAEDRLDEEKQLYQKRFCEIEELRDADLALRKALDMLEHDFKKSLRSALSRVNVAFLAHIQELLGGTGSLESTDGLSGIRLTVGLAHKRTAALDLLSTGEKTLVALAFLFSLSDAQEGNQGLPIAILDEVDAPLDEANIRRFTRFLREHARRGTQFILVTHQKATMEVADAIWGVTSQSGLSRVFSIRCPTEEGQRLK